MADYAYDYNGAYDFESFAPKKKQQVQPQSGFEPRIVKPRRKSESQKRRENSRYKSKIVKVVAVAMILFALLSGRIYSQVVLTAKMRTLDEYNAKIKTAQSENVSLNNKLNAMMSLETVEQKAVKDLHMVKGENSQIHYVHVGSEDNYTDGKNLTQ